MVDFDLQPVCGLLLNQFITDADMADFDSQPVRGLVSNLFTRFLTLTWLIWTLSLCVLCSRIHSISDIDMAALESQIVRNLLSNLLT